MADISTEALQRYCYCIDAISNYLSSVDTVVNDLMYIKSPALRGKAIEMFNESMKTVKVKLQYLSNEMHSYAYKHPVEDSVAAPSPKCDSLAESNSLTECSSLADEYAAVQKLMRSSFKDSQLEDQSYDGCMKKQAELGSKATRVAKKTDKDYKEAFDKTFPKVLEMIKNNKAVNLHPQTPGYAVPETQKFTDDEIDAVQLREDEKISDNELHSYLSAIDKLNSAIDKLNGKDSESSTANGADNPANTLEALNSYVGEMSKIAETTLPSNLEQSSESKKTKQKRRKKDKSSKKGKKQKSAGKALKSKEEKTEQKEKSK